MKFVALIVFLAVYATVIVAEGSLITSARVPVRVELDRVRIKTNGTDPGGSRAYETMGKAARSKPLLFQQALGLEPGKPFNFDLTKWRVLQNSGLFKDLSARTVSENGQVTTVITGKEVPAITFAPEVQVGASLEHPEISGGVMYRDNNFRGLGERVEVVISAFKEGLDRDMRELPPSFSAKWIDGVLGRDASVTVKWEENYSLENARDLTTARLDPDVSNRLQTMQRNVAVTMDGVRTLGEKAGSFLQGSGLKFCVEPFQCEIKPLDPFTGVDGSTLTGAKFRLKHFPKPSLQARGWPSVGYSHEVGVNTDPRNPASGSGSSYQTLGLEVQSPRMLLKESTTVSSLSSLPIAAFAKIKWDSLLSRGAGRVPLKHFANFENPRYIRGFDRNASWKRMRVGGGDCGSGSQMGAFSVLRADLMADGVVTWGTPGFFFDTAFFRSASGGGDDGCVSSWGLCGGSSSSRRNRKSPPTSSPPHGFSGQAAAGLSFKAGGFRVDLGWPLALHARPKFFVGLDSEDF